MLSKSSQLYAFNSPITKFLNYQFPFQTNVFAVSNENLVIECNENQVLWTKKIGGVFDRQRHLLEMCPFDSTKELIKNNIQTIHTKKTTLFMEDLVYTANGQQLIDNILSIKTILLNSRSDIIGTFGFGFLLSEKAASLQAVTAVINELGIFANIAPITFKLIQSANYQLTAREKDVGYYLVRGYNTKMISKVLNLSPRTIETHLDNMKHKLNCNTKAQLTSKLFDDHFINLV